MFHPRTTRHCRMCRHPNRSDTGQGHTHIHLDNYRDFDFEFRGYKQAGPPYLGGMAAPDGHLAGLPTV
eukprot:scaffold1464_cov64-Attheya_sp.AAC.5